MWAGMYSLDLYCDKESPAHQYSEFPHQYTHELGSVCRSRARKAGWIIKKDGTSICPKCNPRKKKT